MEQGQERLIPSGFAGMTLSRGTNLCHVYYGNEHLLTKVVPFISAGLDHGEKCMIFLTNEAVQSCTGFLGTRGETALSEGKLAHIDPGLLTELCRQGAGELERFLSKSAREALADGFKLLRLAVDMEAFLSKASSDKMLAAGRSLGAVVSGLPIVMLCEYPFNPDQNHSTLLGLSGAHTVFLNEALSGGQEE